MKRRQKKAAGDSVKPRFPEPQLDSVDWAQKILFGSEQSRLLAVYDAKEKRDPEALPALARILVGEDEVSFEARDALPVIVEANPGHEKVFEVVPELERRMGPTMDGYFAVWTLARICEVNPKKFQNLGARLIELANMAIEASDGYFLEEIAICLGQMGVSGAAVPLMKGLETMNLDEEVRVRIEKVLSDLGRQAYMH